VASSDAGALAVDLLYELVAIPSVTGSEGGVIDFFEERFRGRGWSVETIDVSPGRRNIFVRSGPPRVVLTTHVDTVPPYFEPRRKGAILFARGACDAKGSLSAMAVALERVLADTNEAALLLLVGEERGSDGALAANRHAPAGVEFLVGGEPTGNRFVAGSKGCLRISIEVRGRAGHSSNAESGFSAVPPLLDFLDAVRRLDFPADPTFGQTTMNIGVLEGGTAPNVTAERARAEVLFRTGLPVEQLLSRVQPLVKPPVTLQVPYRSDPIRFRVPKGWQGEIVSFACDLPLLPRWGQPILIGPGSILDAHAAEEKVDLSQIEEAVVLYEELVRSLLSQGGGHLAEASADSSVAPSPDSSPFTSRSHPRA
jgi:acetylornithine deacetylase